jgi:PEP-CTERM motif
MKRNCISLALACTVVALLPRSSQADPIAVLGGSLVMEGTRGTIRLFGSRGFTLIGLVSADGGRYGPAEICPCTPGTPIEIFASWSGSDLGSFWTLDGQTYPISVNDTAFVQFTGPAVVAPPLRRRATLMTTFDLAGTLFYNPEPHNPLNEPVLESFGGAGKATFVLESFGGEWGLPRARYQVQAPAPVPEPGTIFLLGGGLAALAARARRKHSKQ